MVDLCSRLFSRVHPSILIHTFVELSKHDSFYYELVDKMLCKEQFLLASEMIRLSLLFCVIAAMVCASTGSGE